MSSSLQRSRSLRKPNLPPADQAAQDPKSDPRNVSPSRLPVKPPARTASTAAAGSSSSSATAGAPSTGLRSARPASGSLARTPSTRQAAAPAPDPVKKETSRYPPSTAATRPRPAATAARPTSSDGAPSQQLRRAPTHTRAKSTATAASSTSASTVLRPPSQGPSRPPSQGPSRPPSQGPSRPPSQNPSRPPSQGPSRPSSSTSASRQAQHPRRASVDKGPAAAAATPPRLRPSFTTLQQHYSPAKALAPKPLTSAILAPPSPSRRPANVAASAEAARLQHELLLLHLLHRDAPAVDARWRHSAREELAARFAALRERSADVEGRERVGAECANVKALRAWARAGGALGLDDKIQALDAVVNGLWALSETGGRYARVVRRFERWVDRVCEVEGARRSGGAALLGQQALFVGELDAGWKEERAGLARRLDGWRRQLAEAGPVPDGDGAEGSGLARMVEGSRSLIRDMLEELRVMEEMEQEAVAREDEWVERMNRDEDGHDTPRAGAIWRVV